MEIEFRNVTKSYGTVSALSGVSLLIPAGDRVAIVGPNGSGKSTLMRIVTGLLSYDGEVLVDGAEAFAARATIAPQLAYAPQKCPELTATVGAMLNAVAGLRGSPRRRIERTALRLGLDLGSVADRSVRSLSGGNKHKLMLATALATDASLLIVDEPTTSLDPAGRRAFFDLWDQQSADATLIMCSHRLEEVSHLVDHVVVLGDGRVRFDGPVSTMAEHADRSVVEVWPADEEQRRWLSERGFVATASGVYARTVGRRDKMVLLSQIFCRFDGGLRNLVTREADMMDAES